jgi:phosphatidylethanolamine/phosphatidyl-N-methylethanolamine N-methyltransferase
MQIAAVKAAYRRYSSIYDTVFGPVLQPGRKAVVDALGLRPGERVLEVGVGTGLSLPLYPHSVTLTGIDLSSEMLEKARRRARRLPNVEALLEMNAEAMTFPDQSFDKVVAMYVISVVENPQRLLDELHRVCKPDGEIFLVNHFHSENPIIRVVERGLARFSDKIGFHADFELPAGQELTHVSRVNYFWKVMRLKNGIAHARFAEAGAAAR